MEYLSDNAYLIFSLMKSSKIKYSIIEGKIITKETPIEAIIQYSP